MEDVLIRDLKLEDVPLPFTFTLDWNPSYSYATIPKDVKDVPHHWTVLSTPVLPVERGYCQFRNITIENVDVRGARKIFSAAGLADKPILNVKWVNITAEGGEAGAIEHAMNWPMTNVTLKTKDGAAVRMTNTRDVGSPVVSKP